MQLVKFFDKAMKRRNLHRFPISTKNLPALRLPSLFLPRIFAWHSSSPTFPSVWTLPILTASIGRKNQLIRSALQNPHRWVCRPVHASGALLSREIGFGSTQLHRRHTCAEGLVRTRWSVLLFFSKLQPSDRPTSTLIRLCLWFRNVGALEC